MLLAAVVGRLFIGEMPFREPVLSVQAALAGSISLNLDELTRVAFSLVLLAAVALWLFGAALQDRMPIRCPLLAGLIIVFAVWSLVSISHADDKRNAVLVSLEQIAMLSAGWMAAQAFVDARRFRLLVAVLAAAGAVLAVKGLYQVAVENPETLEMFLADRSAGKIADTSHNRLLEARLRSAGPMGWFPLGNVYGAALIVLTACAAAVVVERIAAARRALSQLPAGSSGQIPAPTLQAVIAGGVAVACVVAMVLAKSTGVLASVAVGIVAAAAISIGRRWLVSHWRRALLIVGCAAAVVIAAAVAHGLKHDSLPTKTMTFRWQYWTATADVIAERPVYGVGGGNFADAYLLHRRAEAEEAVKLPHNAPLHAAAQFGIPGGIVYVAMIVFALVAICRPRRQVASPERTHGLLSPAAVAALLAGVVLVMRLVVGNGDANWGVAVMDGLIPAALLAAGVLAFSAGGRTDDVIATTGMRITLGCAVGAFVLHNLVSVGLWVPATATVFWVIVGALLAQADDVPPRTLGRPKVLPAVALAAAVCAIAYTTGGTIVRKTAAWSRVAAAIEAGAIDDAATEARKASVTDLLDGLSFAEAARFHHAQALAGESLDAQLLATSLDLARLATGAQPHHSEFHRLAGGLPTGLIESDPGLFGPQAVNSMSRAAELDPMNARLRIAFAQTLLAGGRTDDALRELQMAESLNNRLAPDSLYRLVPDERVWIAELRQQAEMSRPAE